MSKKSRRPGRENRDVRTGRASHARAEDRERAYREAVGNTGARTVYHVRHVCGHPVYWDRPEFAMSVRDFPCAWCGAETGIDVPPHGTVLHTLNGSVGPVDHCRQDHLAICSCERPTAVIVRHLADDSCCQGAGSIN
jgi:hypothetical protein